MEWAFVISLIALSSSWLLLRAARRLRRLVASEPPACRQAGCACSSACELLATKSAPPLALLAFFCTASFAHAADTTEPFDKGAVDAELYLGVADPDTAAGQLATDLVFGYGLTKRLSLTVAVTFEQALREQTRNSHVHLGGLFNLFDTTHVDLDLQFCSHVGGAAFDSWQVVPGFELNIDSDDQRGGVGLYLRAGVAFGSHPEATEGVHRVLFSWELPLTTGAYWTVARGHQLLLEADMGLMPQSDAPRRFNLGGVAVGYNLELTSWLELINQLHVDVPQADEAVGYAATTGVIMTL